MVGVIFCLTSTLTFALPKFTAPSIYNNTFPEASPNNDMKDIQIYIYDTNQKGDPSHPKTNSQCNSFPMYLKQTVYIDTVGVNTSGNCLCNIDAVKVVYKNPLTSQSDTAIMKFKQADVPNSCGYSKYTPIPTMTVLTNTDHSKVCIVTSDSGQTTCTSSYLS